MGCASQPQGKPIHQKCCGAKKRMNAMVKSRSSSIDEAEVARFSALAAEWWDPKGKFRPLHKFNPVRLAFIRDQLTGHYGRDPKSPRPLEGLRLLDIGCGGGLLCEPLSRMGASVVGADASRENIETAALHAKSQGLVIDYRATTAEALAEAGEKFDAILNMEVIEHVADPAAFVVSCGEMLKPNALMVLATLNRTLKALGLAVIGAEYILGWLPRGTHDWSKFLTPEQLQDMVESAGLIFEETTGVVYNPLTDRWSLSSDRGVNYMAIARNPA
jgi:2-polyprenyl-6-hydroxyphenyl methylase/3-demethylubiquinone-9 3-methyltransferase